MATQTVSHPSLQSADRLFIGGEWVAPGGGKSFTVISAHTGEVYGSVAEAEEADVDRAVAAARQAFDHGPWPRMSHAERAAYLNALADAVVARGAELGQAQTHQMGALHKTSQYGGHGAAAFIRQFAGMAETFPFVERHPTGMGAGPGLLVQEAVGVVGAIIPWNAPLMLAALKLAPALLAGCTVVLKASPEAPTEALILAEICAQIGLPAGVVNVLTADRAVSERLVRHPDVDKISFTGSSAAGKRIASLCGERIARCTLELGGKSAAVLLDDYDVEKAAAILSGSLMLMSGQVCAALTRVVVPRAKQKDFGEAMAAAFEKIRIGDPFSADTDLGPVATERQRDRVEGYIAKGKAEGATLATGGERPSHVNAGWFVQPTLFLDVDPDATIAQEEIFGPVASVIPVDSEEQAIEVANSSVFGLNSAVFTDDGDAAWRVGRRLRAGTVGHNGFRTDFSIAFGGFKQSGLGREGGTEGLRAYLEPKTIVMDIAPDWPVPA